MADKATTWAIILGMTYAIMSIAVTLPALEHKHFTIAALFLIITTIISKPQQ